MANSPRSRWPLRAARWLGFTLLLLALLVGAVWLALPPLVKHFGEQQIEAKIGRKASIGAVAFDPFKLVLTVSDFLLYERDNTSAAFSARTLLVDVAPAALFKLAPLLSEVRLVGPQLHIVRTGDAGVARYNFSDVIERVLAMPKSAQPTLFSVANIQLEHGAITFDDRFNDKQVKVEALSIGLPYLSNFPDQVDSFVQPRLSATVNGSQFVLKGRSKPFAGSQDTALALDVERLDLASYMKFSPVALPLAVQSAKLSTKLDLTFVRNRGRPQVVLSGTIKLADVVLHDNRAAPLLKAQEMLLQLRKLDLLAGVGALEKVEIVQPQLFLGPGDVVGAQRIGLENASVDAAARTVAADALRLAGLQGEVRRDARGAFNVQQLSGRVGGPAKAAAADKAAPAWLLALKQFAVSDGALAYTDGAVKPAVKLRADDLNLTLDDISSRFDRPLKVTLRTQLNKTGKLSIDGSIAPQFKSYDLAIDAQNLQVPALQPYFADYLNVTLASGQASGKGTLLLVPADAGKETATTYRGMLRLANFRMLDKETAADFLKWRALDVNGINLSLGGPRQNIGLEKVALSDFYARIILSESAKLNLGNIVVSKNAPIGTPAASLTSAEPAAPSRAAPLATAVVAAPPPKSNAPVIRIGQITIKGGNINYTDNFVKPNYTANMTGMNGTVGAIASDKPQPAPLDLSGKIDNDAAVAISGTLNPLFSPMFLDIKASANGVELPRLTPYAAKYAGYAIEKGKLSMAVSYRVEQGKLVAQNDVRIDQLTFGEKIDSPTATKLPVMLAVALLKDRNGQININLPISGTLGDPQFSLGGIIVRIFLNLVVKAVTSPFALIGSAFGGGDELGYAEFSAGSASLTEASQGKLDTIGKALTERPGLKLDLIGRVDPGSDADGVRQQVLRSKLNAFKRKESLDRGGESVSEDVGVTDADKEKYMGKVYAAQTFDKPRNLVGLVKSLPPAEMEKLILANSPVTADALRALASRRAEAVRAYLETKGVIAAERIFLVAPKVTADGIADKGAPNRVDFALK
ncbi:MULTISPECIES: DUF748 domain-containing protein [unclassified Janthinobacterium]|uniref:DUF748 domain-containing protein n=1 Tax=unclassified Janthinobacterium TaxID=2610881 RepID=UPI00036F81F3|nr:MULTISPECIES: DUF748 domain-containing protein [unclassified Janthinobacterium]MEC5163212.1 hypothetical protein [Janthinobacterium sp. CG_S6]